MRIHVGVLLTWFWSEKLLDLIHGMGHAQIGLWNGGVHFNKYMEFHTKMSIFRLTTLPQLFFLALVLHGTFPQYRDFCSSLLLESFNCTSSWSQKFANKVDSWKLFNRDEHSFFKFLILGCKQVQIGFFFSILFRLSFLDPIDFCESID